MSTTPMHTHTHTVYNGSISWLIFEGDAYYTYAAVDAEKGGTCVGTPYHMAVMTALLSSRP